MIARMPVRSSASSSAKSKPSRLSISSWLRIRSAAMPSPPDAGDPPPPAAQSSFLVSLSSAMRDSPDQRPGALVDQHLLDQDGVRLGGRDHQVDAAQDLHPQLVGALAARQVLGAQ